MDTDYVIVVHGTFAAPVEGQRDWFQLDEGNAHNFCHLLNERLKQGGDRGPIERTLNGKCVSFSWSGANDHAARLAAAEKLYRLIVAIMVDDPSARVHIVAHSHGGNVVLGALHIYLEDFVNAALGWYYGLMKSDRDREDQLRAVMEDQKIGRHTMDADEIFSRLTADKAINRIGRVVLLGTPFYQKIWRGVRQRWLGVMFRFALYVLAAAFLAYVLILVWWCAVATVSAFDWVGGRLFGAVAKNVPFPTLDPLEWSNSSAMWFGGAALLLAGLAVRAEFRRARRDIANLYFDEHGLDDLFMETHKLSATPFETLVVNMGLLDEALLGLSAEPIVYGAIAPRIRSLFQSQGRVARSRFGEDDTDVAGLLRAFVRWLPGLFWRATAWPREKLRPLKSYLLRPILEPITRAMESFVLRIISSAAFGVPPQEFSGARIVVREDLGVPRFFRQHVWNIGQKLLCAAKDNPAAIRQVAVSEAIDRYAFLADDVQLDALAAQSQLYREILKSEANLRGRYSGYSDLDGPALVRQLRRVSVTVEHRLADLVVGFGHVRYYSIPYVIEGIAKFISTGEPPPGAVEPS